MIATAIFSFACMPAPYSSTMRVQCFGHSNGNSDDHAAMTALALLVSSRPLFALARVPRRSETAITSASDPHALRPVLHWRKGPGDQLPQFVELSPHEAGCPSLDQHVADRSRLHRTSQYPPTRTVRRQLAEQRVLASA